MTSTRCRDGSGTKINQPDRAVCEPPSGGCAPTRATTARGRGWRDGRKLDGSS